MNAVEEEVLRRIVPSPEVVASIKDRADRLKEMVESYVASHGIDAEARFTGSYSKNTYLSDPDLDLFLLFPPETDPEDLKRIGLKAGEDILHGMRMYSDHPYTRGVFEGLDVDMVPCFHIDSTEHMKSAVDRTPFHTAFVKSRLDDDGCNQVRLLKKFMKGIGAYGAEQDSRGFSGYLCEILVVKYRTFDNVLRAASKWRNGTVIDVNGKGPKMSSALVISGGPMMGMAQYTADIPVAKGTGAILAFCENEEQTVEHPQCIRCGKCVAACPMHLEPLFMYQYAEKGMIDELNAAHIMDCMECGACAYACPARMHLTHMFKTAKQLVKNKAAADKAAAEAKKAAEEKKEA